MTKSRNESTICHHSHGDAAIHIIAVSRTLHSSNHNVLWLRNTDNGHFESLAIVFDDAI